MKKKVITKGSRIDTLEGHMMATGFNGHSVTFECFEPEMIENERGRLIDTPGGQMIQTGERRLTLHEIRQELMEVGEYVDRVVWIEPE